MIRRYWVAKWEASFAAWVSADSERQDAVAEAYNRALRGYVVRTYRPAPLEIARWNPEIVLLDHQVAGARRVLDQRGGLVAFDVGVGKTYTALGILARARQEGWARRPVVLVPNSLAWKWYEDFSKVLPDYRVAVIGSRRHRLSKGKRYKKQVERLERGDITRAQFERLIMTSRPDAPKEQAAKWSAFQAGAIDAVILTETSLGKTQLNEKSVVRYAERIAAIQRSIRLQQRNLKGMKQDRLTERSKAILEHGVSAWVQDKLALPRGQQYVPGIVWDDLGIDLLIVDEAADYKNLYLPEARDGGVPKYMGGQGEGSDRAWQLDFRAHTIRERTGGAGVVLLTATPAKNSPLEFYNLVQYIDPDAWTRVGIDDPEGFIDRYIKIEPRYVPSASLDIVVRSAVVGFKNLDELRSILFRYAEFRTAAEVGIKLPQPRKSTVEVEMDERQEAKYRSYLAVIEKALDEPGPHSEILGIQQRLAMVALHSELDEGYDWDTAEGGRSRRKVSVRSLDHYLKRGWVTDGDVKGGEVPVVRELPKPDPYSAKFEAIAQRIVANADCGHIVFSQPKATHRWLKTVLVEYGVAEDRIAIMNGSTTSSADRQRIAREFNGDRELDLEPQYDVVIANSVAYEGVDLQVRTCAIHHADLPWTPSDIEQRNGRAWRQGNTLGTIEIYYYVSKASMDAYRFGTINGKATWLAEILTSDKSAVNNPAAEDLDLEDLLIFLSRDKEKTEALIERRKKRLEVQKRRQVAEEASKLLRRASGRFRQTREMSDSVRAAELRAEGERILSDLRRVDPIAWPWARWVDAVRNVEFLVPRDGSAPVFEGLRVARLHKFEDRVEAFEFGRLQFTDGAQTIGVRAAGGAIWSALTIQEVRDLQITPEQLPGLSQYMWPESDEERTERNIQTRISWFFRSGRSWDEFGWRSASDAFLERWWPRFERAIAEGFAASYVEQTVPIIVDDQLRLVTRTAIVDGEVLAPNRAGWHIFLRLAPESAYKFGELKAVGEQWWGRRIPRDLLVERAAEKTAKTPAEPPAEQKPISEPVEPDASRPTESQESETWAPAERVAASAAAPNTGRAWPWRHLAAGLGVGESRVVEGASVRRTGESTYVVAIKEQQGKQP